MSEVIIVEEVEKTHKFYDIYNIPSSSVCHVYSTYCNVNINVKKFYYNQDIHTESVRYYYDITYSYDYIDGGNNISYSADFNPYSLLTIQTTNPFYYYKDKISEDSLEGVIILSNRVTNALVEYLLMEDTDLEREIHNNNIIQYRTQLMYSLSTFWD